MHFFLKLVTVLIFLTPFGGDLVFEHFFFSLCFDMCRFLFLREKSLAGLAVIYFFVFLCNEVSDGSVDELRQARDLFYCLFLFCVCVSRLQGFCPPAGIIGGYWNARLRVSD